MDASLLTSLNAARRGRRACILVTDITGGQDRLVIEGDVVPGAMGAEIEARFRSGKSGVYEANGVTFFLNVHVPPPRIVAIGAVHITQALQAMAPVAGFDLRIIDPRTAFATPERFAGADLVAEWPEDALKDRPLDPYTALVAVTHDPKIDDFPLAAALKADCFYVGALGSRKTHAKRVERLIEAGLSEAQIARVSAPIGLDIGASTPAEIAVSVLADIIQALRRRPVMEIPGVEA